MARQRRSCTVSERARSTQRRGTGQVRQQGAQGHGAEAAQAPHRSALHRGVQGVGRRLRLGGGRHQRRGARLPVARRPGHREDARPALRLHGQAGAGLLRPGPEAVPGARRRGGRAVREEGRRPGHRRRLRALRQGGGRREGAEQAQGLHRQSLHRAVSQHDRRGAAGELSILYLFFFFFFFLTETLMRKLRGFAQVLNRVSDTKQFERNILPPLPPILPQHYMPSGTRKDCVRLRGLPYEAAVEHILEFLGELSKNIKYQGVHMVYNATVRSIFVSRASHNYSPTLLPRRLTATNSQFAGPALGRGLHPDEQRGGGVRVRPAAPPSLHDLRQEAALHRGVPVQRRRHEPRADERPSTR
uniref:Uncharacterized protein n=1 Tax=Trichogramma kaykai TaxID=54128 RepID=A0ABD2X4H2_9HYME